MLQQRSLGTIHKDSDLIDLGNLEPGHLPSGPAETSPEVYSCRQGGHVNSIPWAAVTDYHKLDILKQHKYTFSEFWKLEV